MTKSQSGWAGRVLAIVMFGSCVVAFAACSSKDDGTSSGKTTSKVTAGAACYSVDDIRQHDDGTGKPDGGVLECTASPTDPYSGTYETRCAFGFYCGGTEAPGLSPTCKEPKGTILYCCGNSLFYSDICGVTVDAGTDATTDTSVDSTADTSIADVATDSSVDSTADSVADSAADSIADTTDATTDSTADSVADVIADSSVDSAADSVADTVADTSVADTTDAAADSVADTAADSSVDSAADSVADTVADGSDVSDATADAGSDTSDVSADAACTIPTTGGWTWVWEPPAGISFSPILVLNTWTGATICTLTACGSSTYLCTVATPSIATGEEWLVRGASSSCAVTGFMWAFDQGDYSCGACLGAGRCGKNNGRTRLYFNGALKFQANPDGTVPVGGPLKWNGIAPAPPSEVTYNGVMPG